MVSLISINILVALSLLSGFVCFSTKEFLRDCFFASPHGVMCITMMERTECRPVVDIRHKVRTLRSFIDVMRVYMYSDLRASEICSCVNPTTAIAITFKYCDTPCFLFRALTMRFQSRWSFQPFASFESRLGSQGSATHRFVRCTALFVCFTSETHTLICLTSYDA